MFRQAVCQELVRRYNIDTVKANELIKFYNEFVDTAQKERISAADLADMLAAEANLLQRA